MLGHYGVDSGGVDPMSPHGDSKDNRTVWLFQGQEPR